MKKRNYLAVMAITMASAALSNSPLAADRPFMIRKYFGDGPAQLKLPFNQVPSFNTASLPGGAVGLAYSATVSVSDGNAEDPVSISCLSKPAWLSCADNGNRTATLSGMPDAEGSFPVSMRVSDGRGGIRENSYSIQVAPNGTPIITSSPVVLVQAGDAYSYTITAADTDNDPLSFSAPTLPAWMDLSGNVLSGNPTDAEAGDHPVVLEVSDGRGSSSQQPFAVRVNAAPEFTLGTPAMAQEGGAFSFALSASDANGDDTLSFAPVGSLPTWLTLSGDTLEGTPQAGDVGHGPDSISMEVTDGRGGSAITSFDIELNAHPKFSSTPNTIAAEGIAWDYAPAVSDADSDTLAFAMPVGPSWLAVNPATGELSGTAEAGDFDVTLQASDGRGGVTEQMFTITSGANAAPAFTSTPGPTFPAAPGIVWMNTVAGFSYSITATDADASDTLAISIAEGPGDMVLTHTPGASPASASLTWNPIAYDGMPTQYSVRLEVTDGRSLPVSQAFPLYLNAGPSWTSPAAGSLGTVVLGQAIAPITFVATAIAAPVTYTKATGTLPPGLTLSGDTLSGTPTTAGTYNFSILATDTLGAPTSGRVFSMVVNGPPAWASPAAGSIGTFTQGTAMTAVTLSATDVNTPVTYSIASGALPSGVSISGTSISGTPGATGTFNFTVRATDSTGLYSDRAFSMAVNAATYASCNAIKTAFPASTDGIYSLNVSGVVFDAYCDMAGTLTGSTGGWTLIFRDPGASYDVPFTTTLNGWAGNLASMEGHLSVSQPTLSGLLSQGKIRFRLDGGAWNETPFTLESAYSRFSATINMNCSTPTLLWLYNACSTGKTSVQIVSRIGSSCGCPLLINENSCTPTVSEGTAGTGDYNYHNGGGCWGIPGTGPISAEAWVK